MHSPWIFSVTAVLCTAPLVQFLTSYKGLKEALKTTDSLIQQLSELREQSTERDSQLSIFKDDLTVVYDRNTSKAEIILLRTKEVRDVPVIVDANNGHKIGVHHIKGHCSQLNAEIWCLRLGLWRNNHGDERILPAQNKLFGHVLKRDSNTEHVPQRYQNPNTEAVKSMVPDDITRPPTGYRIRKEYRTLSFVERQKYHNAVRKLYDNGFFSAFARVHMLGIKLKGVHKGEAFLPWHRVFIALYEEALRQIDPDVSLPFWDSRIEYNMVTPILSVMWDADHLGTGFGLVNDGPFANFSTDGHQLQRRIGQGTGSLIKPKKVEAMFQGGFCRMRDIHKKLENSHNGVHRWVGSTMATGWSAIDPTFYIHHAFIDKIWEDFRKRQNSKECNYIDPGKDYPYVNESSANATKPSHMADKYMDGMEFLKNEDGIKNFWTQNWYGYADSPNCSSNCNNSPDLTCEDGVCVGVMSKDPDEDIQPHGGRRKRAPPIAYPTTQLYPSYKNKSAYNRDNNRICRTQPYSKLCPKPAAPLTPEEIAIAILNNKLQMPDKIQKIYKKLQLEKEKICKDPSENKSIFYREIGDIENDTRTVDTATFDLLKAMLEGKRILGRKSD